MYPRVKVGNKFLMLALPMAISVANIAMVQSVVAEETALEEMFILGSRTPDRSAADLPVPVDVISAAEFNSVGGGADITDNLNALIPSYLAAPATGDGSSFVRPTSLRGMASDQTLVLVNGKRRHRSSLVQLFAPAANNGSHAADIGMIPSLALQQVEVLRDGAASQYGSDAIAGVINFNLKTSPEDGTVQITAGEHFEGEASWKFAANKGFNLNDKGFVNLTFEQNENDGLSRGIQRQANYDGIIALNPGIDTSIIGADAPFGEEPLLQTWGRPQSEGIRFVINSAFELSDTVEAYFFGNYAETDGINRFFHRNAQYLAADDDGNLTDLKNANTDLQLAIDAGATNLGREALAGFNPTLHGAQVDKSGTFGLRGELANESSYDFSISLGRNELDYKLRNTLNGSLALVDGIAQRDFDPGAFAQDELAITLDFTTPLADNLHMAYGWEYREEQFTQKAGEAASYFVRGSSGLTGFSPDDASETERSNYAVYADLEHDISDAFLLQYALRYEDFSDFGETVNWKLAGRYNITDEIALRGGISTGFHAPTPGQANLRTTTTTFDNNNDLILVGHQPAFTANSISLGAEPLKEETATNFSFGATAQLGESTSLTADWYLVQVDDRIYRNKVDGSSFYTNALDVEHRGVDIVLTTSQEWSDSVSTDFVVSYGYNDIEIVGNKINPVKLIPVVNAQTAEDIENNYPEHKWTATANTGFSDDMNLMLRARYIGEHYDERGSIDGTLDGDGISAEIDGILYIDLEVSYDINEELTVAVGGANIFDEYPDEIDGEDGQANRIGVGLQYPRRSVQNYEGGSWYIKGTYNF